MFFDIVKLTLVSLALPITALASSHGNLLNRHHGVARRDPGHVSTFERRVANSKWSYYNVQTGNAGSCGQFHQNTDFTVAMNAAQMDKSLCFKTITMSYGGKTTTATISDTCPGCPWGGLDLTEGLFAFFAPHSVGIIYGTWEFAGAAAPAAPPVTTKKTTTWQPPTTTWRPPTTTWKPPTTTWKPPTTSTTPTSTWTPPKTTSTTVSTTIATTSWNSTTLSSTLSSSSSSTTPSSSIDYLTGPAAGLAIPTGAATTTKNNTVADSSGNIANMYQAFVQVGGLMAGAGAI